MVRKSKIKKRNHSKINNTSKNKQYEADSNGNSSKNGYQLPPRLANQRKNQNSESDETIWQKFKKKISPGQKSKQKETQFSMNKNVLNDSDSWDEYDEAKSAQVQKSENSLEERLDADSEQKNDKKESERYDEWEDLDQKRATQEKYSSSQSLNNDVVKTSTNAWSQDNRLWGISKNLPFYL